ncbi:MAG: ABC transporter substrate-binding protein [Elusimicrobia bacterium]|nr:ABC transporter substrate-binding protein [Elusimicrobiota bacterium]
MTALVLLVLLAPPALRAEESVLVVCDDSKNPATLDPQRQFSEKNHTILQQIFDGLIRLDPEGRVEPALARSWKRLDDRTVEFQLRSGVFFHDGEPFDAGSVRFSIRRYLDPATGFPARSFISTIEDAVVVDTHTVRIVTHRPDGLLLHRLAAFVLIVPPGYVRKNGPKALDGHPIGTGAFRFARWEKGRRIVLEANPSYWMEGYPKLKGLVFEFLPENRQIDALLNGEVDLLTEMPGTATSRIARSGKASVVKKPTFYTIGFPLNTHAGPLRDRRAREALNLATDKRDLIRYDQLGNAEELATLSMPGEVGHDPDLLPYPYDPDRARRLLREAGHSGRLKLRAVVKIVSKRAALILRRQWEKVGVDLEITWASDDDIWQKIQAHQPEMAFGGCPDPMAHAFFIANLCFHSKSPYSLTRSAELDAALERVVSSANSDAAEAAMRDVDRLIHRDSFGIFTYQKIKTYAVRNGTLFIPYVTGMPYFLHAAKLSKTAKVSSE